MPVFICLSNYQEHVDNRAQRLMRALQATVWKRTSLLFAWLLLGQWVAAVIIALVLSPLSWEGTSQAIHVHVWTALILGGVIVAVPVYAAFTQPEERSTRHSVAIGQMLISALFIHLTGGRIETHFHVFGSLAFLSFYRDWRVLITASLVVVLDHVLRGIIYPQSIYGVMAIEPMRWLEHAWWVVFEDCFLIKVCRDNVKEMYGIAQKQAELEETRARIEDLIEERTVELRQLAQIVQSSADAIISESPDGAIASWNRGAERIFGYSADEVRGRPVSMLIPLHDSDALVSLDASEVEYSGLRRDGSEVPLAMTRSAVSDENGCIVGVSAIMRDVTERKEAEKRVSEFYSVVSHELRTPLTSVRGALGLIEGGIVENGSQECLDLVKVARESSDRLIRLINDMLDLKKLESGKLELFLVPLSPKDVVSAALAGLHAMAEEANVEIVDEVGLTFEILGDNDRIIQVVTNLVSNAIKFSPAGDRVVVSAQLVAGATARFSVIDRGCGIPAHEMHKLFGKFQQLDSSDTRAKGGSGLGLSICKALVEQHGGRVGMESEVGKGSTFWFELPLVEAQPNLVAAHLPGAGRISKAGAGGAVRDGEDDGRSSGKNWAVMLADSDFDAVPEIVDADVELKRDRVLKILIADDDVDVRTIMRKQLQSLGFECLEARDGVAAIAITRAEAPDLIILDVGMPYLDGFRVVEVLSGEESSATPLIVYTGRDLTAADRNQLKLGCTRYVTKSGISQTNISQVVVDLMRSAMTKQPALAGT